MPTLLLLIIAVLLLPCTSAVAFAESIPEIQQVKGVFLYEGFQHWLNLAYNFSDSESHKNSKSSKNANHTFEESYNASLGLALFDPLIFDSTLQGSIVFDQNRSRNDKSYSASDNTSYQYNFSGSGLNKSRIPFTLISLRNINTVQNTFTPPTTTDNIGHEFGISFLHDKLQSKFQFARNSTDTTVAGTTSSSVSNSYSYSAEHEYGGFSTTTLSAAFADQSGGTSSGEKLTTSANSLSLTNSLSLGALRDYSLLSSFQMNNTSTDNLPTSSTSLSEAFVATLGRALSLNATYSLTNVRSTLLPGLVQENTVNQGDVRIKHKLFESLYAELIGTVTLDKKSDGNDKRYSVSGNVKYIKNLPAGNRLSLGVSKGYDIVDRQVGSGTTIVIDELHSAVHQADVIQLALADGTLRSVSAIKSRNPIYTYVEGVDSTVNYILGRITILSGGGVNIDTDGAGIDLYISYTLYKDPQIKYSTDSFSVTSDLSLFDKQLTLGAAWSTVNHTLIKGPESNSLEGSRSMTLYVSGSYDIFTGRFNYRNEVSGSLATQTFEGNVAANWQTSKSLISLVANDIYSKYDATATSVAYSENTANATFSYERNVLTGRLTLQGSVIDTRSELRPTKDSLALTAKYQITLNMVIINLSGQTAWIFNGSGTSRNDSAHIDFTRYF